MQHRHVGHAERPGQLPRRLQPARHAEVRQDRPGLVDHEEEAAAADGRRPPARCGPGQCGLQPGGGARHEDAERGGACTARRGRARRAAPRGRGRASSARRTCRTGRRAPAGAVRARRRVRLRAGRAARCAATRAASALGDRSASTTTGTVGTRWPPAVTRPAPRPARPARVGRGCGPGRRWPARTSSSIRRRAAGIGAVAVAVADSSGSGIERVEPHGPARTQRDGTNPHASARSAYSPLGSTTQARRPNTAWRQRNVLTNALLPRPICPNTTMLGLETTPAA